MIYYQQIGPGPARSDYFRKTFSALGLACEFASHGDMYTESWIFKSLNLFLMKISVESRFMKTSSPPMFGMCVSKGQYILV